MAFKAQLAVPCSEPVKLFIVAEPVTLNEPDTLTVPFNVWVSADESPNTFDPLLYIIEDVIVWTYNVWAVMLPPTTKFPLTLKLVAYDDVWAKDADRAYDADIAYEELAALGACDAVKA